MLKAVSRIRVIVGTVTRTLQIPLTDNQVSIYKSGHCDLAD